MARKENVSSYILAGGASSRMKRDKALLTIGGAPLIVRTAALLETLTGPPTVVGPPSKYMGYGLRVVGDDTPGLGPLGGIATALRYTRHPWNLILSCDLPYITVEWLEYLMDRGLASEAGAVGPQTDSGLEPLCAMYNQSSAAAIGDALGRGVRRVTDALASLRIEPVLPTEWKEFDDGGLLFANMNWPEDFDDADFMLGGESGA